MIQSVVFSPLKLFNPQDFYRRNLPVRSDISSCLNHVLTPALSNLGSKTVSNFGTPDH